MLLRHGIDAIGYRVPMKKYVTQGEHPHKHPISLKKRAFDLKIDAADSIDRRLDSLPWRSLMSARRNFTHSISWTKNEKYAWKNLHLRNDMPSAEHFACQDVTPEN